MEITLINDPPPPKPASFEPEELLSFREIIAILQRHRKLIILCITASFILGSIYISFTVPRYTSTLSLLVDPRQNTIATQVLNDGGGYQEGLLLDSQIEVMKSSRLMDKVAQKAGIYDSAPVVARKSFFTKAKEMFFGAPPVSKVKVDDSIIRQAKLNGLMAGMTVNRVRNTSVIAISYTSSNPQYAAKMANLIANVYLDDELEAQYEASTRANDWLKSRLGVLQKELSSTEDAVETYRADNNLVQTADRVLVTEQQLSELNSSLILARADTAQAKARYDNIQNIIDSRNPETATSDVLNNKVIGDLRAKYLELSRIATDILRRQGKDHLAYRNMLQQMQDIQGLIWGEYRRLAQSYKSEYEIAKSKQTSLEAAVEEAKGTTTTTNRSQIALRELQRRADSTRGLYTRMLDKSNEEIERQSLPAVHARIISYAAVPMAPSWPNKRTMMLTWLFFGTAAGVGLAFLREQFEKFLWKAEDLEAASQRTCLGMLPKIHFDREKVVHFTKRWSTKEISVTEVPSREFNMSGFGEVTQMLEKQTGIVTEIMRNVQLATQFNKTSEAKVISFVSARPGEGKSITSCFLAKHLAKTGARVALVDCDFRRPSLTHWFLPGATTGFYELATRIGHDDPKNILMDTAAVCRKTGQENLFFIPAKGANTSIGNLNLVSSGQMHEMITYLKQIFDVVLIDLPPIMNIVDARVIANSIDSFILLAHWGKTDRSIVSKSLRRAPEVYSKTVGTLLTLVDTEKASRYGYYNYNYYYYYNHHQAA